MELSIRTARATKNIVQDLVRTHQPYISWGRDSQLPYEWPALHIFFATSTYVTRYHEKLMDTNQMSSSRAVLFFLRTSQNRLCLYQEDKIYSILGLVPLKVYSKIPKPSYGQQTVQQVYMQMVRAYVQGTRNLDIICLSHHTDKQNPALSSWTPDLRRNERMFTFTKSQFVKQSIIECHCSLI